MGNCSGSKSAIHEAPSKQDIKPVRAAITEEELPESIVCPVCFNLIGTATSFDCGHCLCWRCADRWIGNDEASKPCPSCRQPVGELRRVIALDHLAAEYASKWPASAPRKVQWEDAVKTGLQMAQEYAMRQALRRNPRAAFVEVQLQQQAQHPSLQPQIGPPPRPPFRQGVHRQVDGLLQHRLQQQPRLGMINSPFSTDVLESSDDDDDDNSESTEDFLFQEGVDEDEDYIDENHADDFLNLDEDDDNTYRHSYREAASPSVLFPMQSPDFTAPSLFPSGFEHRNHHGEGTGEVGNETDGGNDHFAGLELSDHSDSGTEDFDSSGMEGVGARDGGLVVDSSSESSYETEEEEGKEDGEEETNAVSDSIVIGHSSALAEAAGQEAAPCAPLGVGRVHSSNANNNSISSSNNDSSSSSSSSGSNSGSSNNDNSNNGGLQQTEDGKSDDDSDDDYYCGGVGIASGNLHESIGGIFNMLLVHGEVEESKVGDASALVFDSLIEPSGVRTNSAIVALENDNVGTVPPSQILSSSSAQGEVEGAGGEDVRSGVLIDTLPAPSQRSSPAAATLSYLFHVNRPPHFPPPSPSQAPTTLNAALNAAATQQEPAITYFSAHPFDDGLVHSLPGTGTRDTDEEDADATLTTSALASSIFPPLLVASVSAATTAAVDTATSAADVATSAAASAADTAAAVFTVAYDGEDRHEKEQEDLSKDNDTAIAPLSHEPPPKPPLAVTLEHPT